MGASRLNAIYRGVYGAEAINRLGETILTLGSDAQTILICVQGARRPVCVCMCECV